MKKMVLFLVCFALLSSIVYSFSYLPKNLVPVSNLTKQMKSESIDSDFYVNYSFYVGNEFDIDRCEKYSEEKIPFFDIAFYDRYSSVFYNMKIASVYFGNGRFCSLVKIQKNDFEVCLPACIEPELLIKKLPFYPEYMTFPSDKTISRIIDYFDLENGFSYKRHPFSMLLSKKKKTYYKDISSLVVYYDKEIRKCLVYSNNLLICE